MKERIVTLKKAEVLKQQYAHYGLSDLIAEAKFTVSPEDTVHDLRKKCESAIRRKVKAMFFAKNLEDKLSFLQDISFGPYKVEVEIMKEFANEKENSILRLLCSAAKINKVPQQYEPSLPVALKLNQTDIAYTFLNKELPEKYHLRKYGLKENLNRIGYFLFADCLRLISKIIFLNTLCEFSIKQKDYIRYKIAEYYSTESVSRGKVVRPGDDLFAVEVKDEIEKYNLPYVDGEETEISNYYSYEEFSLARNDDGVPYIMETAQGKKIIIPRLISTMNYVQEKTKRMIDEHSTYAKSFQDKKHINQKVKAVMKSNKFLTRYGTVELDNDVDLIRFHALEKEFEEIKKKVYIPLAKDYSFRIRKLGKHRAAGLHYAFYRATIIDIEHPSSFMHELGHQIDHTMNEKCMLSEEMSFVRLIQLYEQIVDQNISRLPADDPFVERWRGTTKYNRNYYLQPTEIFARSFELYLAKCKRIESSFLKQDYDQPIYPSDREYLNELRSYFDNLFSKCEPIREEKRSFSFHISQSDVTAPETEVQSYLHAQNGQLLLF
ncbi:LPD1 domain-containing protein [Paenibacillus glucanolyticus]|jgi:hypothetical protein|uniref:Large polyvalent protein-associated domain-containing protein n=1 Tax=Paenibacillus glucanolyticus TaxID=59843 RepID=A0A163GQ34_9BACL|nr:LPD1 domain-containing protein [Paenibacillus glucanolyticus]KZS45087.1 hypothetical protein AWU65_03655 [Paenibacillus glucanolyticus]OMF65492.1 hypothetical protein BK142_30840 [Paenibacillus glucanolyticus]